MANLIIKTVGCSRFSVQNQNLQCRVRRCVGEDGSGVVINTHVNMMAKSAPQQSASPHMVPLQIAP